MSSPASESTQLTPVAVTADLVIQQSHKELLIYDLKNNQAHCLNETSAAIWQMCDGTKSVGEIKISLSRKFDTVIEEDLILLALYNLQQKGLIIKNKDVDSYFTQTSRREIIKRVGFTSMMMLPIISSIIAPLSASAQSGAMCINPALTSCQNPADCLNSTTGDTCSPTNCCIFGPVIPGGGTPSPGGGFMLPF